MKRDLKKNQGVLLVETLFALFLLSIICASLVLGTNFSLRTQAIFIIRQHANRLAQDKIEHLVGVNPELLNDSYDVTNESISTPAGLNNVSYIRNTNVTVNADNTKTIAVTVSTTSNIGGYHNNEVQVVTNVANWH